MHKNEDVYISKSISPLDSNVKNIRNSSAKKIKNDNLNNSYKNNFERITEENEDTSRKNSLDKKLKSNNLFFNQLNLKQGPKKDDNKPIPKIIQSKEKSFEKNNEENKLPSENKKIGNKEERNNSPKRTKLYDLNGRSNLEAKNSENEKSEDKPTEKIKPKKNLYKEKSGKIQLIYF